MQDVQKGCEGVVHQLERWTGALMARDFDQLEHILAPDFQFTVDPKFAGGRMDKKRFIELDRKISIVVPQMIDVRRFILDLYCRFAVLFRVIHGLERQHRNFVTDPVLFT